MMMHAYEDERLHTRQKDLVRDQRSLMKVVEQSQRGNVVGHICLTEHFRKEMKRYLPSGYRVSQWYDFTNMRSITKCNGC